MFKNFLYINGQSAASNLSNRDYKVWSSETIQNWSKLQEQLKSIDATNLSIRSIAAMLRKIEHKI